MKKSKNQYRGVIVSTPTYCDGDYNLKLDDQRKHFNRLIDRGLVTGKGVLLAAGGMGEGYLLTDSEWKSIVDLTAEVTEDRVPSQVGLYEINAREAANKAAYAADAGIDFLQVTPPHYLSPSEDEIFSYYKYINDSADIGIVAYNTPWAMPTNMELNLELLRKLSELENIIGLKWYSHDDRSFYEVVEELSDEINIASNQGMKLSQGFRMGLKGSLDLWGNFSIDLSLKLWNLLEEERYEEYDELYLSTYYHLEKLVTRWARGGLETVGEGTLGKGVFSALGMECGPPFPPQGNLSEELKEDARKTIMGLDLKDWLMESVRG